MVKIAVIGSCVSRDIFNKKFIKNHGNYFDCCLYQHQTSMISLMAPPISYEEEDLNQHSLSKVSFEQFKSELQKNTLNDLKKEKPEILLMDFYADTLYGAQEASGSYITGKMFKFKDSKAGKKLELGKSLFPRKNFEEFFTVWKTAFDRFMEFMKNSLPDTRIIINMARTSSVVKDLKTGETFLYEKYDTEQLNHIWEKMDAYAVEDYGVESINYADQEYFLDPEHPSGRGIVYYNKNFYEHCFEQLLRMTGMWGMEIKLSVIIPVFNGKERIGKCLNSLLKQSERRVEIICVDDGSTDGTKEILEEYGKEDERIEIVHLPENLSALIARKLGFLYAKSDHIWFVDADDEVSEGALGFLIEYLDKNKVDILHFNSDVLDCGAGNRRCIDKRQDAIPYIGVLQDADILKGCFVDKKYTFNLWNKVFSRKVCEQAMECIEEQRIPKGNDLYLYFLLAYYAKSYQGINSPPLYHYCYGSGSTGHDSLTYQQFQTMCEEYRVFKALEDHFGKNEISKEMERALSFVQFRVLNDCIVAWKRRVQKEYKNSGFQYLLDTIGPVNVVSAVHHTYYDELDVIYEDICNSDIFKCRKGVEENIAFYIPGDARLLWCLIENMIRNQQKRYPNLLVITDDVTGEEYFSKEFPVERIPESDGGNQVFHARMEAFDRISQQYHVDTLFYVNYRASSIFYDVLLWKASGKNVSVVNCEFMFANMALLRKGDAFVIQAVRMADDLYTFYQSEIDFWNGQGISAMPVELKMKHEEIVSENIDFHIMWLGEFQNPQYNFYDTIEIMERLIKQVPSAKLHIICVKYTEEKIDAFWQRAKQFGVEQYISIHMDIGDITRISAYANACIMTSSFEICPTALILAGYYKIPVVSYREPVVGEFLEQTEVGVVSFRDYQGMADCLASLEAGSELTAVKPQSTGIEETILYHYKQGVLKYRRQMVRLDELEKKLKKTEKKYKQLKIKYNKTKQ